MDHRRTTVVCGIWLLLAAAGCAPPGGARSPADQTATAQADASGTAGTMTAEATATASAEATGTATPSATLTFTATATASAAKTLAPGTETPTTSATETPTGAGTETPTGDRIGICHRTGSEKNPWRYIEISKNAVEAHRAHGDIIDVGSPAECPQAGTEPPVP